MLVSSNGRAETGSVLPRHVRVVIIGAGFSGLGMAIRLLRDGERDFAVLERGDDVGGTWRANHYPGAACDVPSRLYSFSFAGHDWSRSFSPQDEILDYLRACAQHFGVLPHIRFGCEVQEATWDDDEARWHVSTPDGELTCDVLVSAAGALSTPKLPPIPGAERFAGKVFHSADWDHSHDLAGERVAVVGTGASAIQIVPAIARQVARMDVYQRTAAWIIPRTDRRFGRAERWAYRRFPALSRLARSAIYWGREFNVLGFTRHRALMKVPEALALRLLRKQVRDPELRRKLTPDYAIGCKRILISNDFYPAVAGDNAELVTEPIREITPDAIVTADGTERPVDTIVFATGFQVHPMPIAGCVRGRSGETLLDAWSRDGMQAYRGTTIAGFPNLFFVPGPNTGLGHTSMVHVIESQIHYVGEALKTMRAMNLAAVEPAASAQRDWNEQLQRRLQGTVWNEGGCASWYLDDTGRNTTLWPGYTFELRRLLRRFDVEHYDRRPVERRLPAPVAAGAMA